MPERSRRAARIARLAATVADADAAAERARGRLYAAIRAERDRDPFDRMSLAQIAEAARMSKTRVEQIEKGAS